VPIPTGGSRPAGVIRLLKLNGGFLGDAPHQISGLPGKWLFRRGDTADKVALVRSGRLLLTEQTPSGELRFASLGESAIVSLHTLFDGPPLANAETPTEVYLLSRQALVHFFEHNPGAVASLFQETLRSPPSTASTSSAPNSPSPKATDHLPGCGVRGAGSRLHRVRYT
jgi:hypothetical protein